MSEKKFSGKVFNRSSIKTKLDLKFNHKKRAPPKPSREKTDIYITTRSNFKYDLNRIEKLWIEGKKEIVVRALGAAIPKAINLSLQFQRNHFDLLYFETSTETVNLVDDLEPLTDQDDFESITRKNSSICIKLIKKEFSLNSPK